MARVTSSTRSRLHEAAEHLAHLQNDVARLSSLLDSNAVMDESARMLTSGYGFDCAWLAVRADADAVTIRHTSGMTTSAAPNLRLRRGCGLGGKVFALNKIQWVDDYFTSADITHHYDGTVRAENIHRIIGAPIVSDGKFVGVVLGGTREGATFGTQAADVMDLIARRIAEALFVADAAREKVTAAIQAERTRTAMHLHDSLGALLFAIAGGVRSAGECATDSFLRERLTTLENRTKEAAMTLRRSLRTLQTSDEGPEWNAAMRHVLRTFESRICAQATQIADATAQPRLSIRQREYDVLCRVAMGETNQEIAHAMALSQHTVKSYLRNVMHRLGARNRTEAISRAREAGLL